MEDMDCIRDSTLTYPVLRDRVHNHQFFEGTSRNVLFRMIGWTRDGILDGPIAYFPFVIPGSDSYNLE